MFDWLTGSLSTKHLQDDGKVSESYHTMLQAESNEDEQQEQLPAEDEPKEEFEISMCLVEKRTLVTNRMRFRIGTRDLGTSIEFYNSTKTRGVAVVIGNFLSDDMMSKTHENNINCMKDIFETAGYATYEFTNLSAKRIINELQHIARLDHTKHDSFVFYFCGTSCEGGLCGDGEEKDDKVLFHDMAECFASNSCESLAGKPKIFLIDSSPKCDVSQLQQVDFVWSFGGTNSVENLAKDESVWTHFFSKRMETHSDLPLGNVLELVRRDVFRGGLENSGFPITVNCLRNSYSFGTKRRKREKKRNSDQ